MRTDETAKKILIFIKYEYLGFKEIEKGDNISSYNIYDKSTIQTTINYNMN